MLKPLAIICLILIVCLSPVEGARTYIVDSSKSIPGYETLGGAVAKASSGDTIYVKPGIYKEKLLLDKRLSIMPLAGERGEVVLEGEGKTAGIKITADGCSIEGLTLANFTEAGMEVTSNGNIVKNNKIINDDPGIRERYPGIMLKGSKENLIEGNSIKSYLAGVALWAKASNNRIGGNRVEGCSLSITLRDTSLNNLTDNSLSQCDYGIYLMNTSKSELHKNSAKDSDFGIVLENSSENVIEACSIDNSTVAIGLGLSSKNIIRKTSILKAREVGIHLTYSEGNRQEENQISKTKMGLFFDSSNHNSLINNRISEAETGIELIDSQANKFQGNKLDKTGLALSIKSIFRDRQKSFNNSLDESNVAEGKPIVYVYGQSNGLIRGRDLAHLTLAYCNNFTVDNSSIAQDALSLIGSRHGRILNSRVDGRYGIFLLDSHDNVIFGNSAKSNKYCGLLLFDSRQNKIEENVLSYNNQSGINLQNCSANIIRGNTVDHNREAGVWLNTSNENEILKNNISLNKWGARLMNSFGNLVYNNNFVNNGIQAEDTSGENRWDMGNVTGGNYWSDWKVFGNPSKQTVVIRGGKVDSHPFQDVNGWLKAQPSARPGS
jgi:parallel beta-helix repeat protein